MKTIVLYHAHIPDAFGYGLEAFGATPQEALALIRKEYLKWRQDYGKNYGTMGDPNFAWPAVLEYFGATIRRIESGQCGADQQCGEYIPIPERKEK